MFDALRFRLKVQKIRRRQRKQDLHNRKEWRKKYGDNNTTKEGIDELSYMDFENSEFAKEEISSTYTWYLLRQMDKLLLPEPDFNSQGQWVLSKRSGNMYL